MKRIIPFILTILVPVFGFSQADSISYGPGYVNQVWYSFANGEVKTADNTAWDLSFGTGGRNTDIRINDGFGVELYLYPNGDTAAWNTIDTTGLSSWTPRFNSDTSWSVTAFAAPNTVHPDYGWGIYNSTTHNVVGDSIYIIKLTDGSFKKLKLGMMQGNGDFNFYYADVDGANEVQGLIKKPSYITKKNVYYSMTTDSIMDLEPAKTDWDIVFTKYNQLQPQGGFYKVSGVLANENRSTAEAREIDLTTVGWFGQDYQSNIGIIGSDWKKFNMTTFQYDIVDSLTYFFVDTNATVWQLTFTDFAGGATGMTKFNTSQVGVLSVDNTPMANRTVNVFPNPAVDHVTISIETEQAQNNVAVTVYSLTGSIVYARTIPVAGTTNVEFPVSSWQKGMYLVRIGNDANAIVKQLIIQ
tara:strand:+ start:15102 stop:16340 length:1239 start_codon:yes stop_codon:yes gene_type:complete